MHPVILLENTSAVGRTRCMQMTNILPMQMCGVRGVLVELLESPRKRMYLGRQWNVGRGENDVELHYIGRRTKLDFFSGQL